ncbi:MAG TPA: hypothetical protein VGO25_06415 [Rhodanobacteraceae bacterium]|nr:hypothetical protein [Rhodanobacteraceae bacterium]
MDNGAVQSALKRGVTIAGGVLCVAAAALLVVRGIALRDSLGEQLSRVSAAAFAAALGLYLVGSLLLGAAWVVLVRVASNAHARARPLLRAHMRAQVAKYLPGNVFHFAYRHLAARREGVPHAALGAALGLEAALLLTAAAVIALGVAADPRLDALVPWARKSILFVPVLAVLAWIALSYIAPRFGLPRAAVSRRAPGLALVLAIDFAFFLLAATALRTLDPQPDALPFGAWCGWLSLAWIVGYVTPGAPAGIGLREAVLALGLSPALGESEALALALLYRLVTTIADGAVAALGFLDREAV